ncbi:MAG: IS1595 family transposase [Candidatus Wildermuthbacteria bacterium]|nr:IS1595 family transposase [Candidatus Wildermuthbacteria bacterium]
MLKKTEEARLTSYLLGRKCVFCGSYRLWKTRRGYVKCRKCRRQKRYAMLKRELGIIVGFHQQAPASRLASDLGVNYRTVERVYRKLRDVIYHTCEMEGARMSGEIEIDDAYFGGKHKGRRGRGAAGKSVVLGLLERDGRVYTRIVYSLDAPGLMDIIRRRTRKGSVYYTDSFRSYRSLKRFGKHLTLSHTREFARMGRKYHSHINGIEGFWSYAKHGLYQYRGVSRANLHLYLKEMEYRFNHRHDNLLKNLIHLYFGYICT